MVFPYLSSHVHFEGDQLLVAGNCSAFHSLHLAAIKSRSAELRPNRHIAEQLPGSAARGRPYRCIQREQTSIRRVRFGLGAKKKKVLLEDEEGC